MRGAGLGLGALALLAACASAPTAQPSRAALPSGPDGRASAQQVGDVEERVLDTLASVDARLAARMRVVPTDEALGKAAMSAVVHGDEGVAVLKGVTDLFSFDVRKRRLEEDRALLTHAPELADVAPPGSPLLRPRLEWELLARLVGEEAARLEDERRLPRSASELVRGVVSTWMAPASMDEAKERDTWLARRLDEVLGAVEKGPGLRAIEVTELEDALDPLEHLADPMAFPRVQASVTRLRVALGRLRPPFAPAEGWEAIERGVLAHFGVPLEHGALRALLEDVSASLRAEVTAAGRVPRDDALAARPLLGAESSASCGGATGSRVRSFAPPPERAPLCAALERLQDPRSEATAAELVALADTVTLAIWAVEINGDGLDPYRVVAAHPLLVRVSPEVEGPLMRTVATRPLWPIGVALMAKLVAAHDPEERAKRVPKWLAFGDAPLDIVARELGVSLR